MADHWVSVEHIKAALETNQELVERAIVSLYAAGKEAAKPTDKSEPEVRGFSAYSAPLGSYYARWLNKGRRLDGVHVVKARAVVLPHIKQVFCLAQMGRLKRLPKSLNAHWKIEDQICKNRIYKDARAERGLARLVVWLFGAMDAPKGLSQTGFMSGEALWASTAQLEELTGLCDKFLRRFLKSPPPWLCVNYVEKGWRLSIPLGGDNVQRLLPRAEELLAREKKVGSTPAPETLWNARVCPEAVQTPL
jgi:hypothetical protein